MFDLFTKQMQFTELNKVSLKVDFALIHILFDLKPIND